ncbi:RHS repeat-associated core domain-containing protein [Providencia sp. Me31A]|uniref:RHS repeat-associated core domain-containing protein n=1 Tax=Providencia sp. Me31A TaxID=3392637 RepID=UPI003D2AB780
MQFWQSRDGLADNDPTYTECYFRFAGQYEDRETGLYYNRFRYYDKDNGQYISPDPIGLLGGVNPYGYVHNPVGWIDPLGLNASLSGGTYAASSAQGALLNQYYNTAESANDAVNSLKTTGKLPNNYVTKSQAEAAGWSRGKALGNYVPGGQIGGDIFANSTSILPDSPGRIWYEADIGLDNKMSRAKQPGTRLLYSNDGLTYITSNHYETAESLDIYNCKGKK